MLEGNSSQDVKNQAQAALQGNKGNGGQIVLWIAALIIGGILGWMNNPILNDLFDFVATVFTRMFQFVAVPTIALAVITTLSTLGANKETGRIFGHALGYTLLTTFCAAAVGLGMYIWVAPGNLPMEIVGAGIDNVGENMKTLSYYEHILSVIPNNLLHPFIAGNVLSVLIIAASVGMGLAFMPKTENRDTLMKAIFGAQELLFTIIKGILYVLPVGIMAFSGQLAAQIEAGIIVGELGKYVAVIIGGNCIQFFIVLPLFLIIRGLNPLYVFRQMSPALAVALFTKSSAATLPVTMSAAENNLKVNKKVSRFVLPICTTINMNGCAAFILVTSLFVMQNAGFEMSMEMMISWLFISVLAAVGNAGVPMGCYFLTLSLVSSMGAPINLMGVILPIYAIIDMIETAENVWSDSVVCAMTDHDIKR